MLVQSYVLEARRPIFCSNERMFIEHCVCLLVGFVEPFEFGVRLLPLSEIGMMQYILEKTHKKCKQIVYRFRIEYENFQNIHICTPCASMRLTIYLELLSKDEISRIFENCVRRV